MKKLTFLQAIGCILLYLVGRHFRLELWQVAVFTWVPLLSASYLWFWWFRNIYFHRDPDRAIPDGDNLILSPADGRVMYINRVKGGEATSQKNGQRIKIAELAKTHLAHTHGWLIGIYMTPFDVHYNRAPIAGKVTTLHYHRTPANLPMVDLWEYIQFTILRKAVDLFSSPFHLDNERMTLEVTNSSITCVIILIADKFVNKITRFFQEGQRIQKGEKISFIERGSQTDLFIPHEDVRIKVTTGEQVYAGETIIGTIDS